MDAVEDVVRGAVSVLSARPSALITDIDGTLSPIVSRPESAAVSDSARESLRALAGLIDLVAVVTGRSEDEARRMVGVEGLTYVGHYSLDDSAAARIRPDELEPAKASARSMLGPYPCVQFEDKGVSFSLHYRNCEDEGVRDELMTLMRPLAQRDPETAAHSRRGAAFSGRLVLNRRVSCSRCFPRWRWPLPTL